jgi:hypothetical protein
MTYYYVAVKAECTGGNSVTELTHENLNAFYEMDEL